MLFRSRYAKYNPGNLSVVGSTVAKHGGEFIFAGPATYVEGQAKMANVCIRFPTMDAFKGWSDDPEYGAIKGDRVESSNNYTVFLVES